MDYKLNVSSRVSLSTVFIMFTLVVTDHYWMLIKKPYKLGLIKKQYKLELMQHMLEEPILHMDFIDSTLMEEVLVLTFKHYSSFNFKANWLQHLTFFVRNF